MRDRRPGEPPPAGPQLLVPGDWHSVGVLEVGGPALLLGALLLGGPAVRRRVRAAIAISLTVAVLASVQVLLNGASVRRRGVSG